MRSVAFLLIMVTGVFLFLAGCTSPVNVSAPLIGIGAVLFCVGLGFLIESLINGDD